MRVLVCGGRDFTNYSFLAMWMDRMTGTSLIIHGAAKGADMLADKWATERGIPVQQYPAEWSRDGISAGPIRNQRMLDHGKPDLVVAFEGGKGTADMIRRTKKAGIKLIDLSKP